ncbi:zinc finger E-box-binding homeobox 2-like [Heterodontus francisci]|uniref:zinc finger E-box-binding homeobox 2-like n=1 Tax=Heterodontus francisci TaxID=7792 RepID=UPI00355B7F74
MGTRGRDVSCSRADQEDLSRGAHSAIGRCPGGFDFKLTRRKAGRTADRLRQQPHETGFLNAAKSEPAYTAGLTEGEGVHEEEGTRTKEISEVGELTHYQSNRAGSDNPSTACDVEHKTSFQDEHIEEPKAFAQLLACPYCNRGYKRLSALKEHIASRHERTAEGCFVCALCGYSFSQRGQLDRHAALHRRCLDQVQTAGDSAGERRFKCPECGKAFKYKHHLKEHIRIHSGEKPYECANCKKRFSHSGSYSSHLSNKKCIGLFLGKGPGGLRGALPTLAAFPLTTYGPQKGNDPPAEQRDPEGSRLPQESDRCLGPVNGRMEAAGTWTPNDGQIGYSDGTRNLTGSAEQSLLRLMNDIFSTGAVAVKQEGWERTRGRSGQTGPGFRTLTREGVTSPDSPFPALGSAWPRSALDCALERYEEDLLGGLGSGQVSNGQLSLITQVVLPLPSWECRCVFPDPLSLCQRGCSARGAGDWREPPSEGIRRSGRRSPTAGCSELGKETHSGSRLLARPTGVIPPRGLTEDEERAGLEASSDSAGASPCSPSEPAPSLSGRGEGAYDPLLRTSKAPMKRHTISPGASPSPLNLSAASSCSPNSSSSSSSEEAQTEPLDLSLPKCAVGEGGDGRIPDHAWEGKAAGSAFLARHSQASAASERAAPEALGFHGLSRDALYPNFPFHNPFLHTTAGLQIYHDSSAIGFPQQLGYAYILGEDIRLQRKHRHKHMILGDLLARQAMHYLPPMEGSNFDCGPSRKRLRKTESGLYPCDQCNKNFQKSSSLLRHKYEHTGKRPHQCEICSKAFKHKHHLIEHVRLHSGEKPYRCDRCGKRFSHSGSYSQHMNHRYSYCRKDEEEEAEEEEEKEGGGGNDAGAGGSQGASAEGWGAEEGADGESLPLVREESESRQGLTEEKPKRAPGDTARERETLVDG